MTRVFVSFFVLRQGSQNSLTPGLELKDTPASVPHRSKWFVTLDKDLNHHSSKNTSSLAVKLSNNGSRGLDCAEHIVTNLSLALWPLSLNPSLVLPPLSTALLSFTVILKEITAFIIFFLPTNIRVHSSCKAIGQLLVGPSSSREGYLSR